MAYSIMLDAGHGGAKDPGAVYEGRQEKDDNLKLVLAIGEILSDRGLDVEYTRTTDVYETPYEKAMKANNAGVDLFVSIHRNSFPVDNEVEGVESLVYDLSGLKYEMAQNINESGGESKTESCSLETYKDAGGAGRSRIHQFGYRQSAV